MRTPLILLAALITSCASEPLYLGAKPLSEEVGNEPRIEYRDLTQAIVYAAGTAYIPTPTKVALPVHRCGTSYTFKVGMLRENLDQAIAQCGYSLGEWHIGDSQYFVDMSVKNAFTVIYESGIEDLLSVVDSVYGVKGTLDPITGLVGITRSISQGVQ